MTKPLHYRESTLYGKKSLKDRRFTLAGAPRFRDSHTERRYIHSRVLIYFINILFWSGLLMLLSLMFDEGI